MSKEKHINFNTVWERDYWMKSNGFYCGLNTPDALKGDATFGLPPYAHRHSYLADEYPAVPKNWIPSEGRKTSYFVPVQEGKGMWLDFNKNWDHKYHVAIVVSVQGVNPITGMPCKTAGLEQYTDKCPKHDIPFGPDRYCKKCDYKWSKQNYITTTSTPHGSLWLDGFRTADGIVRQYILTMDKIKGVAANILKEERVFAVGISFFLSKQPKPIVQQKTFTRGIFGASYASNINSYSSKTDTYDTNDITMYDSLSDASAPMDFCGLSDLGGIIGGTTCSASNACPPAGAAGASASASFADTIGSYKCSKSIRAKLGSVKSSYHTNSSSISQVKSVNVKKVEVGAGANIKQAVYDDPEPLDFWRDEVESIICVNYCLENDANKIISAGKISLEGHKESFLKDIPVGNK